jgi:hypothetical protein
MRLDTFQVLLAQIVENDETVNTLYPKIDITNVTDGYSKAITILLKSYYGEQGEDWISWFLYERDPERDLLAYDKDGNEICKTVEELWQICEECKLTKEDYVVPTPMSNEEKIKLLEELFKK